VTDKCNNILEQSGGIEMLTSEWHVR